MWRRLAPRVHAAGLLSPLDVDAFACYCDLVVRVAEAREMVDVGLVLAGRHKGDLVTNPAWRIYRDALMMLRAYAVQFGLTPAARLALGSPDERA